MHIRSTILVFVAGLLLAMQAEACFAKKGPPQEAITVCENAVIGSQCQFVGKSGEELMGQCEKRRDHIVCVPEGHDRRHHHRRDTNLAPGEPVNAREDV